MRQIIGTPILFVNRNSYLLLGDNIGMSIGLRVREARMAAKLSQKDLAAIVGLSQPTLSELETSESTGSTSLASIAAALGVSALWLETGKGNPKSAEGNLTNQVSVLGELKTAELMLVTIYRSLPSESQEKLTKTANDLFIRHEAKRNE